MFRIKIILVLMVALSTPIFAQETAFYTDKSAEFQRALQLYENASYLAAQKAFENIKDNVEPYSEYRADCEYYIANSAVRLEQQNADDLVQRFVDEYPTSNKRNIAFAEVANYYYQTGKYAQALKWLKQIDAQQMSHSESEKYLFQMGYALFATNNVAESKKYFVQLLDSQEYGSQAKYYYGYVNYQQENYQEADKYLGEVSQNAQYQKDVSYYRADMNFKSGKFQEAINAGLPLLNSSSPQEKSEINKIIGESYFNLKKYNEAIPYLKEYKGKLGKWTNTDYYQLGYANYQQKDYENAIAQFNKIIDGQNAVAQNAYYHLAECYLKTNRKSEALNAFRNASTMTFDEQIRQDAFLNYAKLSYEVGNPYQNTADVLQDFLKNYPQSSEKETIKNLIISAYAKNNDFQGAVNYMDKEKLNKQNETYQKVTFERAIQLFNDNKYDESLTYFDKSLSNVVNTDYTFKAGYWKAEALYRLERFPEAVQTGLATKKINITADSNESNNLDYLLGYAYFKQKNYATSIDYFKNFVNAKKSTTDKLNDATLRLGDVYFVTSSYQNAINAYQKSAETNVATADYAWFQTAVSYGFLGNNNQKITILNKLITSYPKSPLKDDAYYVLGTTYTAQNQDDKALQTYDKLIQEFPKSSFVPRALLKKGLIYYNDNQPQKAIDVYKLAVKNNPNTDIAQEAVQNARQIFIDIGKVDEYAAWVKDLKFVNVSQMELENDMFESAEKPYVTNDYAKAIPALQKYLNTFPNGIYSLKANQMLAQSFDNQGKKEQAIPYYQYIVKQTQNEYTEQALVKLSQYFMDKNQWNDAQPLLLQLESVAEHPQNVLYAQSNLMKSYYQNQDFANAVKYADKVLKNNEVTDKVKADAQIIIARSAYKTNDFTKARQYYKTLESVASGELKAEALYYDAFFKNTDGDYKNSNKVVQKIAADYANYKYWASKSLIVMAKNFYALNDAYQATYILESVISNFTQFPDVVEEAKTELAKIKAEQAKTNDSVIQKN